MLIRMRGGDEGLAEYLRTGKKAGRNYHRDELDERVVLDGDLDATDAIIQKMTKKGEKCLHITFSFSENDVSTEPTLADIVREFKQFAFAAYQLGEYDFYAEAHLPRLETIPDERTGGFFPRKKHVHIVIPEINLLTGNNLNPFGYVKQNELFIDSFQEHINRKFGLASPKDNRREKLIGASEMLSRYKGDLFKGLKNDILDRIIKDQITDYDQFKTMIAEFGELTTRCAGKENEYQNVTAPGAPKGKNGEPKGMNLKEFPFSREFIELPQAEKLKKLAKEASRKEYISQGRSQVTPPELEAALQTWRQTRAREIKYLNSGSPIYKKYRAADDDGRGLLLKELETDFYRKHQLETQHERNPQHRQRRFGTAHRVAQTKTLNGLRNLSELDVVRFAEGSEVLLQRDAPDLMEHERAKRADALRWVDDDERINPATGREADDVISQIARDHRERKKGRAIEADPEFVEIKKRLDAGRLLAELSKSHGVIVERYEITKGKDGGDRIRCGTRNLNASDFLTKQLHLPYADVERLIRESYARQIADEPSVEAVREPRKLLWAEFHVARVDLQQQRAEQWSAQRQAERDRRAGIKTVFYMQRARLQGDRTLRPAERKAALAVARMKRLQAEATLRDRIKVERANLKTSKKSRDEYRDFLTQKAQAGNERALVELRRMRAEPPTKESPAEALVKPPEASPVHDNAPIDRASHMTYAVHRNGDVTYRRGDIDVIRDAGRSVQMLREDTQTIETGLRLAQAKFGYKLVLTGTDEFKQAAARVAAEGLALKSNSAIQH